jgi:hypothetical protein
VNYLAHGFRRARDPWLCAGTALPDWLRVVRRGLRAPRESAVPHAGGASPLASLARGVVLHHEEDARFHSSAEFAAAQGEVASLLRPVAEEVPGMRPRFVAHLLVETLLDREIARREPAAVLRYYGALAALDPAEVEAEAAPLATEAPTGLAGLVAAFVRMRFVEDYADDARLAGRIDQVLRRARQPALGRAVIPVLPAAADAVAARATALLAEAQGA